jgi:hypothetical protein
MSLQLKAFLLLAISIIALYVFIPIAPNMSLPHTDEGVFLYGGKSIINNQIPYRDFWDHKGPVIYYINALGLLISNGTQWGIWFLEIINLLVFGVMVFQLGKKNYRLCVTCLALIYSLLFFQFSVSWGNYTEEFNLIFQVCALYLFVIRNQKKHSYLLIGLLASLSILTRPNNCGIFIIIGLSLFIKAIKNKRNWHKFILFLLGFLIIILGYSSYLLLTSSFPDFLDQFLSFNFRYVGKSNLALNIPTNIWNFVKTNFLLLFLPIFTSIFLTTHRNHCKKPLLGIEKIALIDFPLEIILASLSSRMFPHYRLTILLSASILTMAGVNEIISLFISKKFVKHEEKWIFFIILFFLIIFITPKSHEIRTYAGRIYRNGFSELEFPIEGYIKQNTTSDQTVLVWGNQTYINFLSDRFSPTKFTYQTPLFNFYYSSDYLIKTFTDEIMNNPPQIIVDTRFPFPISSERLSNWDGQEEDIQKFHEFLKFVEANYHFETNITNDYDILVRNTY